MSAALRQPLSGEAMYEQPELFPLSAVQIEGFAQPEPRDDEAVDDDTVAEAA